MNLLTLVHTFGDTY